MRKMTLAVALVLAGCRAAPPPAEVAGGLPVETVVARKERIEDRISLIGTLAPWEQVQVFPKVPGILLRRTVAEGDRVEKDETLALVDRDEVGVRFKSAPVESPLAGIVARFFLDPGAAVSPMQPVALVINVRRIKAIVSLIEADLARVHPGQPARVRVEAFPSEEFPGKVLAVSPMVDPASRTTRVEVVLDNPGERLRAGMYARVDLVVAVKDGGVVAPKSAVLHKKGKPWVFVADGGTADMRAVRLGFDDVDRVEIVEGVREGESVIVSSLTVLQKGTRVQVTRP